MAADGDAHYLSAVTVFESKRDAWLVGLLYLAAGAELIGGVFILHGNAPQLVKLTAGSLLIGGVLVILWVLNGTQYMIQRGLLVIHCGPCRYEVPIDEIESVVPSRDSLSAPALSLDRLQVHTPARDIQISPADRRGFLAQLAAADPALQVDGERLVRARPVTI